VWLIAVDKNSLKYTMKYFCGRILRQGFAAAINFVQLVKPLTSPGMLKTFLRKSI